MLLHLTRGNVGLWAAFGLAVLVVLAIDLGLFRKKPREPTMREALGWSAIWAGLAGLFGVGLTIALGKRAGVEFFTGYVLEQALSIDNLLVMMLVFTQLAVPRSAQRPVLVWGVLGAFATRTVMVLTGTALVARFHVLTVLLGAFLVWAAVKLWRDRASTADAEPPVPWLRRAVARVVPITKEYDGTRFVVVRDGVRHVTPLLLALLTIELADAIFALDSIPAVLGVTTNPVVVLTSNVFAVLGLRSLFFALSGLVERLAYLKHGLAVVLGLVGTKMVASMVWEAPAWVTPIGVAAVLGLTVVLSLRRPQQGETLDARQP